MEAQRNWGDTDVEWTPLCKLPHIVQMEILHWVSKCHYYHTIVVQMAHGNRCLEIAEGACDHALCRPLTTERVCKHGTARWVYTLLVINWQIGKRMTEYQTLPVSLIGITSQRRLLEQMELQRTEVCKWQSYFRAVLSNVHWMLCNILEFISGKVKSDCGFSEVVDGNLERNSSLRNGSPLTLHYTIKHRPKGINQPHRAKIVSDQWIATVGLKPEALVFKNMVKPIKRLYVVLRRCVTVMHVSCKPLQHETYHIMAPKTHSVRRSSFPIAGETIRSLQPVQETHAFTFYISLTKWRKRSYSCDQIMECHFYKNPEQKSASDKLLTDDIPSIAEHTEMDIVDLKQKTRVHSGNSTTKTKQPDKCSMIVPKAKNNKTKFIEDLRELVWLPPRELSVPQSIHIVAVLSTPLDNVFKDMAEGNIPGPQTTMRFELLRVCTLRNYPRNDKPYIIRLAQAGFYYAGEEDEVICFVCGMRKRSWCQLDIPMNIHRRVAPNCRFLTHNSEVNVPVPPPSDAERRRFALLDRLGTEQVPSMSSERRAFLGVSEQCTTQSTTPQASASTSDPTPRVHNHNSRTSEETPKFPHYVLRSTRLSSFVNWPDNTGQTPETLAEAGFYYADIGDCVRCFHCGIGLRHWTEEDDVWIEHARWARNCKYLHSVKGDEFIRLVHLAIEYTQDNDEQPTATNGSTGNTPPSDEVDKILRSTAAQSVLEMGYQPRIIKKAIEKVLAQHGLAGITADMIMDKVLEMEDEQEITTGAAQLTLADRNTSKPDIVSEGRTIPKINIPNDRELAAQTNTPERASNKVEIQASSAATAPPSNGSKSSKSPVGGNQQQLPGNAVVTTTAQLAMVTRSFEGSKVINKTNDTVKHAATTADVTPTIKSREANAPSREQGDAHNQKLGGAYQSMDVKAASRSSARSRDTNSLPANSQLKTLREENEALKVQTMCKVCMDKMVCVVFLPCGHLVTCEDCAPAMRKCPICRALVKGTVKTFMA